MRLLFISLCMYLIFLVSSTYAADVLRNPVRNNLDARSGGMGRAYTALSDTLVGAYYNPAGLSFIDQARKTESSSIYQVQNLNLKRLSDGLDFTLNIQSNTPPFIGFFQQFGGFNVALSMIVPKSDTYDQLIQLTSNQKSTLDGKHSIYLFGPSVSLFVSDQLTFGGSVFYSNEHKKEILHTTEYNDNALLVSKSTYTTLHTTEILGIVGMQWMPTQAMAFGVRAQYPLAMSGKETQTKTNTLDASHIIIASNIKSNGYQTHYPSITFGGSYFVSSATLLSADAQYFPKYTNSTYPRDSVMQLSLGVEHYYNPMIPLRFGFFTNPSYAPANTGYIVDIYGLTASVGYEFGANALNAGIEYQFGTGKYYDDNGVANFKISDDNGVANFKIKYDALTFVVGGSSQI
jgi:hypothetical protein